MIILQALAIWLFLLPLIYGAGSLAGRWMDEEDLEIRGILYCGLGLGILAHLLILLGSLNQLKLIPVLLVLCVVLLVCARTVFESFKWFGGLLRSLFVPQGLRITGAMKIFFGLIFLLTFALCFQPEISHDSLAYHLHLPKMFVKHANFAPLTYDEKSYRSLFMEALYTVGILFKNVPVAKIFHLFVSLLTAAALVRVVRNQTGWASLGIYLAAILWLTPTAFNQIPTTYSDMGTAFFVLLSCWLFFKALEREKGTSGFFLSGLLMGFAVATKYLAFFSAFALGLLALIHFVRRKRFSMLFQAAFLFSAGVALGCGYWFLRNYIAEGNPLYPLFTSKFGTAGLYSDQKFTEIGVAKNLWNYLTVPVLSVFYPDRFNYHFWIGPFYLFAFPFAIAGGLTREGRKPLFVSWVVATLWFMTGQDMRFLLQVFPLILWCTALGMRRFCEKPRPVARPLLIFFTTVILLFDAAIGLRHYRIQIQALAERWDEKTFLTRLERTYPVAQWVNQNLPVDARIFSFTEVRQYYFNRDMVDAMMFYRLHREMKTLPPAGAIAYLKGKGLTHILQVIPVGAVEELDPEYGSLSQALADGSQVDLLTRISSQNVRETRYDYLIYRIK